MTILVQRRREELDEAQPTPAHATEVKQQFESLKRQWLEQCQHKPNLEQKIMLSSYQRIIGMSWPVVPLLLEELRNDPEPWLWALEAIAGENPSAETDVPVEHRVAAWIEWGKSHGNGTAPADWVDRVHREFPSLVLEWKEKSQFMSNTAHMARLLSFERIVGMGWPVVPLILERMRTKPEHWFGALRAITGENPVSPGIAGKVVLMAKAWVDWGIAKGLIKPCGESHDQG